jgi:hypothetical protein
MTTSDVNSAFQRRCEDKEEHSSWSLPTTISLNPSLHERALAFYWTYFLESPSASFSDVKQHTRAMLLKQWKYSEPVFISAVAAESLLLYGKLNHEPRSIVLAHEAYHSALQQTLCSLPMLERACSDQYLIAIMIFSSLKYVHRGICCFRADVLQE